MCSPGGGLRSGSGVSGPSRACANATSCPAGAHAVSAASEAATVSHRSSSGSEPMASSSAAGKPAWPVPRGRNRGHRQVSRRHQVAAVLDPPAEPVRRGAGGVVPVPHRDDLGPRVDLDPRRREHRLGLNQPGRRGAVGEDQAVDDEVAVVHGLAEVAAVGVVPFARRGEPGDPVVDPLPDEPAVQARVPVEQLGVVGQAARSVAHGVAVLAEHHRQRATVRVVLGVRGDGLLPPADRVQVAVSGVHLAEDVGIEGAGLALVVDQAARVAIVGPRGHPLQVAAGPGLVAERPHDHAGVVLVPLDGALDAVQAGGQPPGVPAGVAAPAVQPEAVGLQVALVDHQQPVLVAQVEEPRIRRVVAGPHGVDVVPLHQDDVRPHGGLVQGTARLGVPFVPVHAAELDRAAVEPDQPVPHLDAAEPDPEGDVPARAGQDGVVQPGLLVRPGLGGRERVPGAGRGPGQAQLRYRHRGRPVGVHPQGGGAAGRVVVGVDEEVPDRAGRFVDEGHAPEDAGQPPHVLVLEVGPGRPLVHAHRDHVAAGPQVTRDVELADQPAALAVTGGGPVDEHGEARVHPVEAEHGRPVVVPLRRQREVPPVLPRRVVAGHPRRVHRERVDHVGVGGRPVSRRPVPRRPGQAGQLPHRRHRELVEAGLVEVRCLEARGQAGRARAVPELPGPVQADPDAPAGLRRPGREITVPGPERLDVTQVTGRPRVGHQGCPPCPRHRGQPESTRTDPLARPPAGPPRDGGPPGPASGPGGPPAPVTAGA